MQHRSLFVRDAGQVWREDDCPGNPELAGRGHRRVSMEFDSGDNPGDGALPGGVAAVGAGLELQRKRGNVQPAKRL